MRLQPNLADYAEPVFFSLLLLSFPPLCPLVLHIIPLLFSFSFFLPLFPSSLPFVLSSCSSFSFSLLVSSSVGDVARKEEKEGGRRKRRKIGGTEGECGAGGGGGDRKKGQMNNR